MASDHKRDPYLDGIMKRRPGKPLAGSEQRGTAASATHATETGTQEQPPPHHVAAPQVPIAPHGDSGLTGSGPAVAAPSAVVEVREWSLDRHATVPMLLNIAERHARELDDLRKRVATLPADEGTVRVPNVNGRDFYELCQQYRHSREFPIDARITNTVEAFHNLREYIKTGKLPWPSYEAAKGRT